MGKIPKAKKREHVEPDSYPVTAVQFVDLGTHASTYQGKTKQVHRCVVAFEIDGEVTKKGEPFIYYKNYSFVDDPRSNFMKDLKSWLGVKNGSYDPANIPGQVGFLEIVEDEDRDGNPRIKAGKISKLPKKMKVKNEPMTELVSLFLDEDFDEEVFDSLPEWMRNEIAKSPEYADLMEEETSSKAKKAKKRRKDEEEEEEEEDETPRNKKKKRARDEEEEEEEDEEEETEEEEEDEEEETEEEEEDEEEETEEEEESEEEEEEEEERPKARKSPPKKSPAKKTPAKKKGKR